MNNRIIIALAALALLALGLTGCMGRNDTLMGIGATPAPTANYNPMPTNNAGDMTAPNTTANNGNTSATSNGALNAFDWANGAADIERAIARISEISDSRVVVTNSTALVGVKFDKVYKGQLTERIREMVAAEVMKADPSIQTVAVTSESADVEKVYNLSDQIRAGRTASELSADINAIVRNATTLR